METEEIRACNRTPPKDIHTQICYVLHTHGSIYTTDYIYLHKQNPSHLPLRIFNTYTSYVHISIRQTYVFKVNE